MQIYNLDKHQRRALYNLCSAKTINHITEQLRTNYRLTYSEYESIFGGADRPDNYWGQLTGTEEDINWLLLHL